MLLTGTFFSACDVHQVRMNTAGPIAPSIVEVDRISPKPDGEAKDDDEDNEQCNDSSKGNAEAICRAEVHENSNHKSSHSGEEGYDRSSHDSCNNDDNAGDAGSTCNVNNEGSINDDGDQNYDNVGNKDSGGSCSEIICLY
jgi:hypothetical protein